MIALTVNRYYALDGATLKHAARDRGLPGRNIATCTNAGS